MLLPLMFSTPLRWDDVTNPQRYLVTTQPKVGIESIHPISNLITLGTITQTGTSQYTTNVVLTWSPGDYVVVEGTPYRILSLLGLDVMVEGVARWVPPGTPFEHRSAITGVVLSITEPLGGSTIDITVGLTNVDGTPHDEMFSFVGTPDPIMVDSSLIVPLSDKTHNAFF